MKKPSRQTCQRLLWLAALSLGAWSLLQLPFHGIQTQLFHLPWQALLPWVSLNIIIILLLSWRWHFFIRQMNPFPKGPGISLFRLLTLRQAGQAVNFLTPGPQVGGEPLQLVWLARQSNLSLSQAGASLAMDRFFELWTNFTALFLFISLAAASPHSPKKFFPLSPFISTSVCVLFFSSLGASLFFLAKLRPDADVPLPAHPPCRRAIACEPPAESNATPRRIIKKFSRFSLQAANLKIPLFSLLDHFGRKAIYFWQQVKHDMRTLIIGQPKTLPTALVFSLAAWSALTVEIHWLLAILDVSIPLRDFALLIVSLRVAFLLPVPGGIGSFEAAVLWCFQQLQLPAETALGFIALARARDAAILSFGLICLRQQQKQLLTNEPGRTNTQHANQNE